MNDHNSMRSAFVFDLKKVLSSVVRLNYLNLIPSKTVEHLNEDVNQQSTIFGRIKLSSSLVIKTRVEEFMNSVVPFVESFFPNDKYSSRDQRQFVVS